MDGALSLPFWRGTGCAVAAQWADGWSTKSSILEGYGMCDGGAVDGWSAGSRSDWLDGTRY